MSSVAWILLSTLCFATLGALVKAVSADVSIAVVLLSRNLPSAALFGAVVLMGSQRIRTDYWRLHLQRCLTGVAGMVLGIYAIRHLPLATAATLEYTAPLFLVLGYAIRTRTAPRWLETAIVLLGFTGVVLLLRPTLQADLAVPFVAGLLGGALGGMTYRSLRLLGEAAEPGWRVVFFYSVAGSAGGLLLLPFASASSWSALTLLLLLGIGSVSLLAQWTMTIAFRGRSTALLAAIQYTTVVLSVAYGGFFWGEWPSSAAFVGLALVLLSGAFAARDIARNGSRRKSPP